MAFEIRRIRAGTVAVTRLAVGRLRIGRGTNADLAFDDAAVDLEHAAIERDGVSWALSDRDSVTGTWVNGRRIETVRLAAGDLVEIGDHRIRVVELGEQPVLAILVSGEVAARRAAPAEKTPPMDYSAAYRLRHGWLSKAGLSLIAVLATTVLLVAVSVLGRTVGFRPGPVSEAHARAIGARACLDCHRPWRGPVDELCTACHESHPFHQPTQASTPACGDCHTEHRRLPRLQAVPDAACVSCHRDLELKPGSVPTFATRVTAFGTDHPDFVLSVSDAQGGSRRLPLADPAARHSDPATLKLNHQRHLKPGLAGPEGKENLECADCHASGGPDGNLEAVEFERHCQRCHQLGFDLTRPQRRALHGPPELVHIDLLAAFSLNPEFDALSLEERRRRIIQNPTRARGFEPTPGMIEQANRAEIFLYQTRCSVCHRVDIATSPPTLAPVAVTEDWLPHAEFLHERHGESLGLTCIHCHGAAQTSTETADVLLQGIETCRKCHGRGTAALPGEEGEEAEGAGEGLRVPSACIACHLYHGEP